MTGKTTQEAIAGQSLSRSTGVSSTTRGSFVHRRRGRRATAVDMGDFIVYGVTYAASTLAAHADWPWIKVTLSTGVAVEAEGPPTDPMDADEEWYAKATTYGDTHIP